MREPIVILKVRTGQDVWPFPEMTTSVAIVMLVVAYGSFTLGALCMLAGGR